MSYPIAVGLWPTSSATIGTGKSIREFELRWPIGIGVRLIIGDKWVRLPHVASPYRGHKKAAGVGSAAFL